MGVIPTENHHQLDLEKITLAETLKANGYKTIHLGKWHLGDTPEYYPEHQGFDVNIAGNKAGKPNTYFSPYGLPNLVDGPPGEYLTDRLTSEAIGFMEENRKAPFFVYMAYHSVHTPLQAKDSLVQKYIPRPHDNGQYDPYYAAMIETLDHNVGRILESLLKLKLEENTIVVFYSDNGAMPAVAPDKPLRGFKGTLYEGGIRVPLIIKCPGKPGGITSQVPVIGTDLYPTLLDLAGLTAPKNYPLDGTSLRPILEGSGTIDRDALFWHFPVYLQGEYGMNQVYRTTPVGAVRMGDYKLLEFFEDGHLELYDLRNDLGEQYNLAMQYPEKTKELMQEMLLWRKELKVPYPLEKNPEYDPVKIPVNPKMGERSGIYKPNIKQ
jgi:arylsulfatase A-like enzyme